MCGKIDTPTLPSVPLENRPSCAAREGQPGCTRVLLVRRACLAAARGGGKGGGGACDEGEEKRQLHEAHPGGPECGRRAGEARTGGVVIRGEVLHLFLQAEAEATFSQKRNTFQFRRATSPHCSNKLEKNSHPS